MKWWKLFFADLISFYWCVISADTPTSFTWLIIYFPLCLWFSLKSYDAKRNGLQYWQLWYSFDGSTTSNAICNRVWHGVEVNQNSPAFLRLVSYETFHTFVVWLETPRLQPYCPSLLSRKRVEERGGAVETLNRVKIVVVWRRKCIKARTETRKIAEVVYVIYNRWPEVVEERKPVVSRLRLIRHARKLQSECRLRRPTHDC